MSSCSMKYVGYAAIFWSGVFLYIIYLLYGVLLGSDRFSCHIYSPLGTVALSAMVLICYVGLE